jgi:hypothetical protein
VACVAALSEGFVEHHCTGGRDVERADAAGHGNTEQMVACAADEVVEACALAAEDENEVPGQVKLVVVRGASFIETNDPEILTLELFKGYAQMLCRAGAGFDGDRAERGGTALGEDYTVYSGAIGNAKKSAEVLRIFNAVEC